MRGNYVKGKILDFGDVSVDGGLTVGLYSSKKIKNRLFFWVQEDYYGDRWTDLNRLKGGLNLQEDTPPCLCAK